MTVLPNAPIDAATGLPIPTIAVATDGGVSVIKDDGIVINGGDTQSISDIHISKDNRLYYTFTSFSQTREVFGPSSWTSAGFFGSHQMVGTSSYPTLPLNSGNAINITTSAYGKNAGLFLHDPDPVDAPADPDNNNGMVAYATTSYNTGWMHGDIKGAFLSGISTASVTGTELVTNGDFSSALGSTWIAETGGTTIAINSGVLEVTRLSSPSSGSMSAYQEVTGLEVGAVYVLTGEVTALSVEASIGVGIDTSATGYDPNSNTEGHYLSDDWTVNNGRNAVGTMTLTFRAAQSTYYIGLGARSSLTATASFDNISLRKAEEDRSVNAKGLQVFGTITKSAVVTGAELVSYGSFNNSNNFRQPYNSDLNFEQNDFSIMFWIYDTGVDEHCTLISRDEREFDISRLANVYGNKLRIYTRNSSEDLRAPDSASALPQNKWTYVCVTYTGGNTKKVYIDGQLDNTITGTDGEYDIDNTSYGLNIGVRYTGGTKNYSGVGVQLAKIRISCSAQSSEQIKKIYEDEKVLFQ